MDGRNLFILADKYKGNKNKIIRDIKKELLETGKDLQFL